MKVAMFFDGKNFYKALRRYAPALDIHYESFARWVTEQAGGPSAQFVGAYYYTGYNTGAGPAGDGLRDFLRGLETRRGYYVRWEPRVKRTARCKHCGKVYAYRTEKRVDTRLVAELILFGAVSAYDIAVVFSGDQDLIPAVEAVNAMGKQVYLGVWPNHGVSRDLRVRAFGRILLSDGISSYRVIPGKALATATGPAAAMAGPIAAVGTSPTPAVATGTAPVAAAVSAVPGKPSIESEVRAAATRLPYVSMNYFISKWQGAPGFPLPGHADRINALNDAIVAGRLEVYDHVAGNGQKVKAIRLRAAP